MALFCNLSAKESKHSIICFISANKIAWRLFMAFICDISVNTPNFTSASLQIRLQNSKQASLFTAIFTTVNLLLFVRSLCEWKWAWIRRLNFIGSEKHAAEYLSVTHWPFSTSATRVLDFFHSVTDQRRTAKRKHCGTSEGVRRRWRWICQTVIRNSLAQGL